MTAQVAASSSSGTESGGFLLAGVMLGAFAEAIAGTALSLGRNDIIGDSYATPDEFAWLDVSYTTLKFVGFAIAAWLMARIGARRLLLLAILVMGAACGLAALTGRLDALIALRAVQGVAGGVILVVGQTVIFLAYPRSRQPILQAMFAIGAVVAPATIAPALEGWLLDSRSWGWIFFSVLPVALLAAGLLLIADAPSLSAPPRRASDWIGFALITVILFCLTYVFSQGSRWNWFEESRILWLTMCAAASLFAFAGWRRFTEAETLPEFSAFQSADFAFAFMVSFIAGAALFGSAYLIPSFAVAVLAFTPTAAGELLLPSGAFFVLSLLIAAYLIQVRRIPPIIMAPFGIMMTIIAMWMLSGSTGDSGAGDMTPAILLRGFGLGFLFLALTLIAFTNLPERSVAAAIGLFNTGRQLGGLMGVAGLQTLIDHQVSASSTVLSAHLTTGTEVLGERLTATSAMLTARALDATAAEQAAISLLDRAVRLQSTVIAYDTAFISLALLFVVAAPAVIVTKIALGRPNPIRS